MYKLVSSRRFFGTASASGNPKVPQNDKKGTNVIPLVLLGIVILSDLGVEQ
ncbi:MAG: hypothetical protein ACHQRM_06220 [Bacteroidia bacterium]